MDLLLDILHISRAMRQFTLLDWKQMPWNMIHIKSCYGVAFLTIPQRSALSLLQLLNQRKSLSLLAEGGSGSQYYLGSRSLLVQPGLFVRYSTGRGLPHAVAELVSYGV